MKTQQTFQSRKALEPKNALFFSRSRQFYMPPQHDQRPTEHNASHCAGEVGGLHHRHVGCCSTPRANASPAQTQAWPSGRRQQCPQRRRLKREIRAPPRVNSHHSHRRMDEPDRPTAYPMCGHQGNTRATVGHARSQATLAMALGRTSQAMAASAPTANWLPMRWGVLMCTQEVVHKVQGC